LDVGCLTRFTDDQTQARIREEAAAIGRNPSLERRLEVEAFLTLASGTVEIDKGVASRAHELVALGYGLYDALHVNAAESARRCLADHRRPVDQTRGAWDGQPSNPGLESGIFG
jgi:hypothetical protein